MAPSWRPVRLRPARVKALGEVTTGIGGTGIGALLANGPGPVVMRTELDALPMEEKPPSRLPAPAIKAAISAQAAILLGLRSGWIC
jgi:hypothetical protein